MQILCLPYSYYPVHQKMEMLEIKQLKDDDLRDSIFISFSSLCIGNSLTKKI